MNSVHAAGGGQWRWCTRPDPMQLQRAPIRTRPMVALQRRYRHVLV